MRKSRSRAYNRDVSYRKAVRKKRISDNLLSYTDWSWYPHLHQYSKGKIHCSCGMCSQKTRNKGRRRNNKANYSPSINYKISDLRRQISMDFDEQDYFASLQ